MVINGTPSTRQDPRLLRLGWSGMSKGIQVKVAGLPFGTELGECSLKVVQKTMNLSKGAPTGHYGGIVAWEEGD